MQKHILDVLCECVVSHRSYLGIIGKMRAVLQNEVPFLQKIIIIPADFVATELKKFRSKRGLELR